MSADNILIILEHDGKVRVHDVGFSYISSRLDWIFPMTVENSKSLTDYIVNSPYEYEVHKCNTVSEAEGFCNRYMRRHIVEYDVTSIIPNADKKIPRKKT